MLLNIKTAAALLKGEFSKYPVERLSLRIACRTADWPTFLEDGLHETWGDDEVGVFELAPLRLADVMEAAKVEGINAAAFVDEVWRREASPLAAKPVTLRMLFNTYRRDGRFPATQAGLYLEGCRLLCEEVSKSRIASGHTGTLTADQRLIVAARIAAVTVLANRSAVWTKPDEGDVVEGDLLLRNLSGGEESVNGDRFLVSEAAVKEALSTGLFTSRGPSRVGWTHQTYAEFLAALYLTRREVSLPQIMALLTHPGDPDGKLVPQLHESAAWLAGMVPGVFRTIMDAEPELLLRSDAATAEEQDRAALVEALLARCDREELVDDWGGRRSYEKLYHQGLASQVRPYVVDRSKGLIVRRVAMEMAEFCRLESLLDDLVEVALDPTDSVDVRSYAAGAVAGIGGGAVAKLRPLATGDAGEDPSDQLKGEGLRAVWPDHMTADEIFATLTTPKRESYFGAYQNFVSRELAGSLKPADLPVALRWVEAQQRRYALPQAFRNLMDGVMTEAWQHLESTSVTEAFTKAALSRLRQHDHIVSDEGVFDRGTDPAFKSSWHAEEDKRRRIISEALKVLHSPKEALRLLVHSGSPLVLGKDVSWMLDSLRISTSTDEQLVLAHLVEATFDWHDPDQFSTVAEAARESTELEKVMAWHTEAVLISSPEAQRMKANHYELLERREQRETRTRLDPSPMDRAIRHLDEFEAGDLDSWWHLNLDMTLEPYDTHYDSSREERPDLTSLPVWQVADTETRARIVEAAEKYVLEYEPDVEQWLNTDGYVRPVASGYKGIRLLAKEKPGIVARMSTAIWRKWAPVLFTYPTADEPGEDDEHYELLEQTYRHAPEDIARTVLGEIDRDDKKKGYLSALRKIGSLWDERLTRALMEKMEDERLTPRSTRELLTTLMDRGVDEAREFAKSLVATPLPRSGDARARAVMAAEVLIGHTEDACWRLVWPKLKRAPKFGREVISALVAHHEHRSLWHKLEEEQLAVFFVWLSRQYPQAEDPRIEGYHTIGHREQIARWRDSILGHLSERGTRPACDAIRQIMRQRPELGGLKWTLRRGRKLPGA